MDQSMDLPVSGPAPAKEDNDPFRCINSDFEAVHKIAQNLLPGLATACVDNTTGDLFRDPAAVAVELREEMVHYITHRSETFVAEAVAEDNAAFAAASELPPDDPIVIINDFMEDFVETKRKLWSRVSSWLLSDTREDKIDDFVQEMEVKRFWTIDRRESVAHILLRNVDFKKAYHCEASFETSEQHLEHKNQCPFRPMSCTNERCSVRFCAAHAQEHDSECLHKIIQCEQGCSESIMRREMDRHCITVCPMRLMNCPFYQIGCQSAFPQCNLKHHCSEFISLHMLYVLQVIHKHEASAENLQRKVQQFLESQSVTELSQHFDVRSLTSAMKAQEAKMQRFEHELSTNEASE